MRNNHPKYKRKTCKKCNIKHYSFENHKCKKCLECNKIISYTKNTVSEYNAKKFCNRSCSGRYNSTGRKRSELEIKKIKEKLRKYPLKDTLLICKKNKIRSIKEMILFSQGLYKNYKTLKKVNDPLVNEINLYFSKYKKYYYDHKEKKYIIKEHPYDNKKEQDRIKKIAQKYNNKKEFREKHWIDYQKAWRINNHTKGLYFKEIFKHMKILGNYYKRCIYIIEFKKLNKVYIGLTYNYNIRIKQHIKDSHNKNLKKLIKNNKYVFKQITEYIDVSEAIQKEEEYIIKYKMKGYKILNIAIAGSTGGRPFKWNYDSIFEEINNFKDYSDYRRNSTSYSSAVRLKMLDDIKEFYNNGG